MSGSNAAITPGAGSDHGAARLLQKAGDLGLTLGCAESLTGGLLCAELVTVPGASQVLRGAVVAYATDIKADVLGVDRALLAQRGAVDPAVAEQMARGVQAVLGVDIGLATTGVAGPDPQDGAPVGLVYVAAATRTCTVRRLMLAGGRERIRRDAVTATLALALDVLGSREVPRHATGEPETDLDG